MKLLPITLLATALLALGAAAQTLTPIYSFTNFPANPSGNLVQGLDGDFYGTAAHGGGVDGGTVFRVTTNGTLTTLVNFANTNGYTPVAGLISSGDGSFYGTTAYGGEGSYGTVFRLTPNGILTTLISFTYTNGAYPGELRLGGDGNFYGTTSQGGSGDYGTVFKLSPSGTLTTLVNFDFYTNGASPPGGLTLGSDGNFYGTTYQGGGVGGGTVFQVTTNGTLTTLAGFDGINNGAYPSAGLTLCSDGSFYGTTAYGGDGNHGTVFRVTTNGELTTLTSFAYTNGAFPSGGLTLGGDGNFYGTTYLGGSGGNGTVFRVSPNGTLTTLVAFAGTNGASPHAGLTVGSDGNFYGTTYLGGSGGNGTVFQVTTNGTLTTLFSFANPNGASPVGRLISGSDGRFYGTTGDGGSGGNGTVFRVTTNGTLATLVSFADPNGAYPTTGLTLGGDGNFYGMTYYGGSGDYGTVFQVTTNGTLTTLASFANTNGAYPLAGLTLGSDGNLYGTTYEGGAGGPFAPFGYGTVFRVTTNGTLTMLVSFANTNGANPRAGLTVGSDGNLYGTTASGGSGNGTVFQVTTNGTLTTLASFAKTNGAYPMAGLTLGSDGNLYGTTYEGGAGGPFAPFGYGTVFRVTTNGTLTMLVSFANTNGAGPQAALILGSDGNFYGTTARGGSGNFGTVFRVTTDGTLTKLVDFDYFNNGAYPYDGLTLGSDGNFYGTTYRGGTGGLGVIYRLVLLTPPTIIGQPAGGFVPGGSNFMFTVTATGPTPLAYQWFFNGTQIAGGTNGSLTVSNVNPANAGTYQVIVENPYGSITSQVATLTMLAPGSSFPPQVSAASVAGGSFQFSWNTVNTFPAVGYQVQSSTELVNPNWVNVGGVLTGTNGALSFTNSLGAEPQRFYRVLLVQ